MLGQKNFLIKKFVIESTSRCQINLKCKRCAILYVTIPSGVENYAHWNTKKAKSTKYAASSDENINFHFPCMSQNRQREQCQTRGPWAGSGLFNPSIRTPKEFWSNWNLAVFFLPVLAALHGLVSPVAYPCLACTLQIMSALLHNLFWN